MRTHTVKTSSFIEEITFDPETRDMTARFINGGAYRYKLVDETRFNALIAADKDPEKSVGKMWHKMKTAFGQGERIDAVAAK